MLYKGRSLKTTLILGAGATRGALQSVKKIRPPLNKDFFNILKECVNSIDGQKHRNKFLKLERFIGKELRNLDSRVPTMEEVFTYLFVSKDIPNLKGGPGPKPSGNFRPEIRDFLILVVSIFNFLQSAPKAKKWGLYSNLTTLLEEGDAIITLNYDTLLDNALLEIGWNPIKGNTESGYGFRIDSQKVKFKNCRKPSDNKRILLLKPHGSLNWYGMGKIRTLDDALRSKKKIRKIIMSPAPGAYNTNNNLIRFFIPPLYSKFTINPFWQKLWTLAFDKIVSCERLIIIGCSFNPTDFHFSQITRRALERRKNSLQEIIIIEKYEDPWKKIRKIFKNNSKKPLKRIKTLKKFVAEA